MTRPHEMTHEGSNGDHADRGARGAQSREDRRILLYVLALNVLLSVALHIEGGNVEQIRVIAEQP